MGYNDRFGDIFQDLCKFAEVKCVIHRPLLVHATARAYRARSRIRRRVRFVSAQYRVAMLAQRVATVR